MPLNEADTRAQLIDPKALPQYIVAYINSLLERRYIEAQLTRAISQVNVNANKLRATPIPVPPLREQAHIIEYLDSIQSPSGRVETGRM